MSEKEAILRVLRNQSCELRELDVGYTVPRVPFLSSLEFLRDYVSTNKPVVFTDVITHWPALTQWSKEYLIQKAGDDPVTVALTPNGRADCPTPFPPSTATATTAKTANDEEEEKEQQLCFAFPYERKTSLSTFFNLLEASLNDPAAPVPYMQFQNSSLTTELPQLVPDVAADLPFATEAFGCHPEAVNLWIGGKRTITSFHKDHYENLYAMVKGQKSFRLLPPTDSYRMKQRRFPPATWHLIPSNKDSNLSYSTTSDILTEEEVKNGVFELKLNNPSTAVAAAEAGGEAIGVKVPVVGEDYIIWSGITPTSLHTSPSIENEEKEEANSKLEKTEYTDPSLPEPIIVTLQPGEMLYLPACWWHEVHHNHPDDNTEQNELNEDRETRIDSGEGAGDGSSDVGHDGDDSSNGIAIAVNFWYDMKFDVKYATIKALEELAITAGLNQGEIK